MGIVNDRAPPLDSAQLSLPLTSDVLKLQRTSGSPGGLIPSPMPSVSDAVVLGGGQRGLCGKTLLPSLATLFKNYHSTSQGLQGESDIQVQLFSETFPHTSSIIAPALQTSKMIRKMHQGIKKKKKRGNKTRNLHQVKTKFPLKELGYVAGIPQPAHPPPP